MKMLSASHEPIKTTQFFQDVGRSPHLCRCVFDWRSGITGRSPEVKWRHDTFFANKSRQDGDRDAQRMPYDLACRAASEDVHVDLLGSWFDLDLTWGQIFRFTFQVQKVHVSNRLDEANTTVSFLFHISHIKKGINEKPSPWKTTFFIWWPLELQLLILGQIWSENVTGTWGELINSFFEFFLAIIRLETITIVCKKKIVIFSKFDLWWALVTSILISPENGLSKSLRSRRGLSYAVYRLSLSSVVSEFGGGGRKPPPRQKLNRSEPARTNGRVIFDVECDGYVHFRFDPRKG